MQLKGPGVGVLNGYYTDKATYDMLTAFEKNGGRLSRIWQRWVSGIRASKTVFNVPTHARNYIGNFAFVAMDGELAHLVDYFNGQKKAIQLLVFDKSEAGLQERQRLMSLGLIASGAHGEEFHRALEIAFGGDAMMDVVPGKGIWNNIKKIAKLGTAWAEKAYAFEDNVFKVAAFYSKEARGISPEEAARQVKRIYPSYDQAPLIVDYLASRVPLAPDFMSFRWEAIRCMCNCVNDVMFDKMIMSPLKGFLEATKFKKVDPRKQVVFDIFNL